MIKLDNDYEVRTNCCPVYNVTIEHVLKGIDHIWAEHENFLT